MERRSLRNITRKEWVTSLGAGLAGVVNGAGLMVLDTPALLGLNSFWEIYVTSCLLGAVAFPVLTVVFANTLAHAAIEVTTRTDRLASFVGDLVDEFGLATVTTPLGIATALALWLVFGVLVAPFLLITVGRGDAFTFPHLGRDLVVGYLVYGLSLGGFYGLLVQERDLRRRAIRAVRPGTRRQMDP